MKERDIAINAGAILLLVALIEFFVPRRLIVMGIPLAILAVLIGYTNYLKYRWERQIFSQADSSPLERKILLWSGIGALAAAPLWVAGCVAIFGAMGLTPTNAPHSFYVLFFPFLALALWGMAALWLVFMLRR